jgi:shikimate dehydrogenase
LKKLFTIFGNPVSHSKSPLMHNYTFEKLGFDGYYGRTHLQDGDLIKEKFLSLGLSGANITLPFKENAYRKADEVVGIAKKIGAVNTYILKEKRVLAYNTDAEGFLLSISEFKDVKDILILGAGGTAKALSLVLKEAGYSVTILNRSDKSENFKGVKFFTDFEAMKHKFDLIVNSTSAGLSDENLPIDEKYLKKLFESARYSFDAIYRETPFIKLSKESNLTVKNGLDMLLYQGVIASELFMQNRHSKREIEKFMRYALENF